MNLELIRPLMIDADTKIVLLVMDGVGGLPRDLDALTELEAARTPNLDELAAQSMCGLHESISPGVTPGSGPAHLALFGYDPVVCRIGRGVLSVLGLGFDLTADDVAARGNFCTVDEQGIVQDRRAGRIPTEKNEELCELLRQIELPGAELFIRTVKEYRFSLVLRGKGLSGAIADTDPQAVGKRPLAPEALSPDAAETAGLVKEFLRQARGKLADQSPANMVLLRGFSKKPDWPQVMPELGLRAAALAGYPMYRGVAKLAGMDVLETNSQMPDLLTTLERNWASYDFFFVHFKYTDSAGEDGDFGRKTSLIEQVDQQIDRLMSLDPDVLIITGDHSTPCTMKSHSWHPIPVMIWSKRNARPDNVAHFSERECVTGALGPRFPAKDLLPLALAYAGRLGKFGA